MTNKLVIEKEEVTVVELEGSELQEYNDRITALETSKQEEETAKETKEALKTSAKAKLVAGTPLTEEEANTIVL